MAGWSTRPRTSSGSVAPLTSQPSSSIWRAYGARRGAFDLPSFDGVDEVMIDKDVVEGRKEPVRVFAKKEKEGAA